MVQSKQDLYELISDQLSLEAFEEQIHSRYVANGELLDEETIALLIVDELGKNTHNTLALKDLSPGLECSVIATVSAVEPLRTFQRKNGSNGCFIRLTIADETGCGLLILWNEDTKLITSNVITVGSQVKIVNGYTKKGYGGVEIHVGQWSVIEKLPDSHQRENDIPYAPPASSELTISGKIDTIEPTRVFLKDDGTYGFVTTLFLKTTAGMKQLTVWGDQVKQLQDFKLGDHISVSHVDTRVKDGIMEYHINENTTILRP